MMAMRRESNAAILLVAKILETENHQLLFAHTGKSEKNVVTESLKAGAKDFLVKPFERDTLIAKVRQVLNGR